MANELQESTFSTITAPPGLQRGTATPTLYTDVRDQNSGPYICALGTSLFPQPQNLYFRHSVQIQLYIEIRDTSLKREDSHWKDVMLLEDYLQDNNKL